MKRTNLLICGEVHGVRENADVVYTLCNKLHIKQLAIENNPSVKAFIDSGVSGVIDFSIIDPDTFEASVLSIEMAKTIILLLREGVIGEIRYIDTYLTDGATWKDDNNANPQKREHDLARNILALDLLMPTLCLMGQWHTVTQPVVQRGGSWSDPKQPQLHYSALYHCRQELPDIAFLHSIYRSGQLYNDGRIIDFPYQEQLSSKAEIIQKTATDFDLVVPVAHKISVPTQQRC